MGDSGQQINRKWLEGPRRRGGRWTTLPRRLADCGRAGTFLRRGCTGLAPLADNGRQICSIFCRGPAAPAAVWLRGLGASGKMAANRL